MMPLFFGFGLVWIAGLAVWIWALVDCIQVADDSMYRSGTKLIWVLVIVFATVIGAILYLVIGRPEPGTRPGSTGGGGTGPRLPPPPPPG